MIMQALAVNQEVSAFLRNPSDLVRKDDGVKRLLAVSAMGIGESWKYDFGEVVRGKTSRIPRADVAHLIYKIVGR